jgi:hypothetical protein
MQSTVSNSNGPALIHAILGSEKIARKLAMPAKLERSHGVGDF